MEPPEPANVSRQTASESHVLASAAETKPPGPIDGAGETASESDALASVAETKPPGPIDGAGETQNKQYHTVASGETLYSICRRYGVTIIEIRQLNDLGRGNMIYPGQRLLISR